MTMASTARPVRPSTSGHQASMLRAHVGQAAVVVVQVGAHRAAAAGVVGHQRLDAGGVEHARGGAVDVGHHRRLHAAHQHQHLARDACASASGARARRRARAPCSSAPPAAAAAPAGRASSPGANSGEVRPSLSSQRTRLLAGRALDALARRSCGRCRPGGRSCTPLGQVLSQLRQVRQRSRCSCVLRVGVCALEHLLDQVDAAARAVELVAEQLVGRAGGGAEAAVHALAQDGLGRLAFGRALELGAEGGLHRRFRRVGWAGLRQRVAQDPVVLVFDPLTRRSARGPMAAQWHSSRDRESSSAPRARCRRRACGCW